jgi:RimJ/RimL family protein N-acetyltransferase
MADVDCVGAAIRDERHRVYAHRRSDTRRLLPGTGGMGGGHLEPGETTEEALAREIEEETGWRLRRIEAVVADWTWEHDGVTRRELDYLVEVDGDLTTPRLEEGKHDAFAWVGPDNLELMMEGRTDGDRRLRDIVAKATRIRLTQRLRLEPIGPEHIDALLTLHDDAAVAEWHGNRWTREQAHTFAVSCLEAWGRDGVHKWIAFDRATGELVGRGGLSRCVLEGREELEVGWTVLGPLWGEGYGTEIGRAALAFAFDELGADRIVAFTEVHNMRSRAVMERLGMRYAYEFPWTGLIDGREGIHEDAPFALYATEHDGP